MFSVAFYLFVYDSVVMRHRVFCCVSEQFVKALGLLCVCGSVGIVKYD